MSAAAAPGSARSTTAPPTSVPVPIGRASRIGSVDHGRSPTGRAAGWLRSAASTAATTAGSSARSPASTIARPERSTTATPSP
jgi:hypothetical protein